jgi:hypothetical protein
MVSIENLPSKIASAIAPAIRPLSVNMSDMSDTRLEAARAGYKGIILITSVVSPCETAPPFRPYNWRPLGYTEDLQEIPAFNGKPREFYGVSSPQTSSHALTTSSPATRRAAVPVQQAVRAAAIPAPPFSPGKVRTGVSSALSSGLTASRLSSRASAAAPPTRFGSASSHAVSTSRLGSLRSHCQPSRVAPSATDVPQSTAVLTGYGSLLSHLESAIPDNLKNAGVSFADARHASLKLYYSATESGSAQIRSVTVSGHTDAAALHPRRAVVCGRVIHDLSCALVLIDWKTPAAMRSENAASVQAQLCSQIIAFREQFGYSAPGVATDLSTAIRVWNLEGQIITEYVNASGGPLSLSEGVHLMWQLILKQVPIVSSWLEAKRSASFGRTDDDDDSVAPPDLDSSAQARASPPPARLGGERSDSAGQSGGFQGSGCAETGEMPAKSSKGKQAAMPAFDVDLYEDLEQEALAARITSVWNNSASLQGLIAQIAASAAESVS